MGKGRGRISAVIVLTGCLIASWAGSGKAGELLIKFSHPQAPGTPFDVMAQ